MRELGDPAACLGVEQVEVIVATAESRRECGYEEPVVNGMAAEEADFQVGKQASGMAWKHLKLLDAGPVDNVVVVLWEAQEVARADGDAEEDEVAVRAEDPRQLGEFGCRQTGEANSEIGDARRVCHPEGHLDGMIARRITEGGGGVDAVVEVCSGFDDDRIGWRIVSGVVGRTEPKLPITEI